MKKTIKAILATLFALTFILSAVSCGSENETPTDSLLLTQRYQYNMSEYFKIADYSNVNVTLAKSLMDYEINSALISHVEDIPYKDGDVLTVTVHAYFIDPSADTTKVDTSTLEKVPSQSFENKKITMGSDDCLKQIQEELTDASPDKSKVITNTFDESYTDDPAVAGKSVYYVINLVSAEKTSANGDYVYVSYTGYTLGEDGSRKKNEDGKDVTFDSSSKSGFLLGSGKAIDDFEKGITGMYVGQTKTFMATFPDNYDAGGTGTMNGKTVEFEVKLLAVAGVPEFTDSFVKENYKFETVADFKKSVLDYYKINLVIQKIKSESTLVKYPEKEKAEIEARVASEKKTFDEDESNQITFEQYLDYYYNIPYDEYVTYRLTADLMNYCIAKEQGITVSEDECVQYFYDNSYTMKIKAGATEAEAKAYAQEVLDIVNADRAGFITDSLRDSLLYAKVEDYLDAHSTITEGE